MELIFSLNEIEKAAEIFLSQIKCSPLLRRGAGGEVSSSLSGDSRAEVIAFHGEMGAGKTTFIKELCKTLGVVNEVCSPTYSIINEYETNNGINIYHIDLYRLKNEQEAINAGVEECFYSGNYCFIEWPEIAPNIIPENAVHCYLNIEGNNERKLQINL